MPAITVDDITTLDRIPRPEPEHVQRPVQTVTTAPSGFEGEGFPVRRASMARTVVRVLPSTGASPPWVWWNIQLSTTVGPVTRSKEVASDASRDR